MKKVSLIQWNLTTKLDCFIHDEIYRQFYLNYFSTFIHFSMNLSFQEASFCEYFSNPLKTEFCLRLVRTLYFLEKKIPKDLIHIGCSLKCGWLIPSWQFQGFAQKLLSSDVMLPLFWDITMSSRKLPCLNTEGWKLDLNREKRMKNVYWLS